MLWKFVLSVHSQRFQSTDNVTLKKQDKSRRREKTLKEREGQRMKDRAKELVAKENKTENGGHEFQIQN